MPETLFAKALGGLTQMLGKRTQMAEERRLGEEETLRKMGLWKMERAARREAVVEERGYREGLAEQGRKRQTAERVRQEDAQFLKLGEQIQGTLSGVGLGMGLETAMTTGLRREAERLEGEAKALPWWEVGEHQRLTEGVEDARAEIDTIRQKRREAAAVPPDIEQDILAGTIKSAAQAKTIIAARREKATKETARETNARMIEEAGAADWIVRGVRTGETTMAAAMILHEKVKAGELGGKKAKPTQAMQKGAQRVLQRMFDTSGSAVTKADLLAFGKQHPEIWEPYGVTDDAMKVAIIKRTWQEWYAERAGAR